MLFSKDKIERKYFTRVLAFQFKEITNMLSGRIYNLNITIIEQHMILRKEAEWKH